MTAIPVKIPPPSGPPADRTDLRSLAPGEKATVRMIAGPDPFVCHRLLEMGLTRGTVVEFVRTAPLGDPIEIVVRGYRLSLRKDEAASILVERVTP